jgi:hypothetical protein
MAMISKGGFRLCAGIEGWITMKYAFRHLNRNMAVGTMLASCWEALRSHYQGQDAGNEIQGLRIVRRV